MANHRTNKIKLTRAEKQQLKALMARNQNKGRKGPHTAQDTIPYQRMWPDGICRVTDQYYTKTIQFQDINYQLAQNDDKTAIFEGWCDFLNYFDSSIHLQFSFLDLTAGSEAFEQSILIPDRDDGNNEIRHEYAEMLQNQQAKGNNGLTKTKFITFSIEAENIKTAKPRLERIEIDILNNFKKLGVSAFPLDGRERLKLMHDMFHMDTQAPFLFDWKWLPPSGLSTKDFIAPSSFDFREKRSFGMGKKQAAVSFFSILASDLNDRCLADFLAMESSLVVSLHIQAIDQVAAIRDVKRKITDLDKMKIEEQKKAVRAGYDMDIIPSDLATYGGEAKKLLEDLQSRNERMFLITFLVMNTADNRKQLTLNVKQAQSLAQQHNCQLIPLDFQQENGMVSCLPLGLNKISIQRGLTTSSTAIFIPFTSQELFQSGGEALYCGLNALSHNLIMVDRKKLKNPNGLILGTPGSGKSFAAKREICNVILLTDDDIIICDPEGEYYPLVKTSTKRPYRLFKQTPPFFILIIRKHLPVGRWEKSFLSHIRLIIGCQRKDVFIDEVNANRLGLGSQYPGSQCNLIGIPCYVADFLRNDQINLSIETVLKKPGPFFSVLHVRCSLSLIHIEVHQRPVWTQSDGINELLLMKEQVVLMSGLIEITDIDANPIMCVGAGILVLQTIKP